MEEEVEKLDTVCAVVAPQILTKPLGWYELSTARNDGCSGFVETMVVEGRARLLLRKSRDE